MIFKIHPNLTNSLQLATDRGPASPQLSTTSLILQARPAKYALLPQAAIIINRGYSEQSFVCHRWIPQWACCGGHLKVPQPSWSF